MRSRPLLLRLGTGAAPDFSLAAASVTVLELDAGFDALRQRHGAAVYKAADWRPFAWRGEVYLGHWTAFMPIEERMSISRLDLDAGVVRFMYRFHELRRARCAPACPRRPQAACGASDGAGAGGAARRSRPRSTCPRWSTGAATLCGGRRRASSARRTGASSRRATHCWCTMRCCPARSCCSSTRPSRAAWSCARAPATTSTRPASRAPPVRRRRTQACSVPTVAARMSCHTRRRQAACSHVAWERSTLGRAVPAAWRPARRSPRRRAGLDMAAYEMHTSGHPVPWDVEGGADHRELVSMLHVRHGDYAHWAVRIDRATRRITHISAGPVVKSVDFRNEVRRHWAAAAAL